MVASSSRSRSTIACRAWAVAESLEAGRQRGKPGGILGLKCEEFAGRGTPALRATAAGGLDRRRGRAAGANRHGWLLRALACAMAGLALGVAQYMLALRRATSRHDGVLRYVTQDSGDGAMRRGLFYAVCVSGCVAAAARCLRSPALRPGARCGRRHGRCGPGWHRRAWDCRPSRTSGRWGADW